MSLSGRGDKDAPGAELLLGRAGRRTHEPDRWSFERLRRAARSARPLNHRGRPRSRDDGGVVSHGRGGGGPDRARRPVLDPSSDGPTIQRASQRALERGTSLRRVLELAKRLRDRSEVPLLLMGHANPFYAMGPNGFAEAAAEAGVDGVIVADLPPEEGADLYGAAEKAGIDGVLLAGDDDRRAAALPGGAHTGASYYACRSTGVTGARAALAPATSPRRSAREGALRRPGLRRLRSRRRSTRGKIARFADGRRRRERARRTHRARAPRTGRPSTRGPLRRGAQGSKRRPDADARRLAAAPADGARRSGDGVE